MTVNKVCHTTWDDVVIHVCGKPEGHGVMHLCPCGAALLMGTTNLTDEQRHHRSVDCPECLARAGRPCHTDAGVTMTGVHASRHKAAG